MDKYSPEVGALIKAGTVLSNFAYNAAQGIYLFGDDLRSLDEVRKAWDAALSAYTATLSQQTQPVARVDDRQKEAIKLAGILDGLGEGGYTLDGLYENDQADGDCFVARAADLLREFAALAQNTQGEDAGLYVEARQCEDCDHLGINDSSDTVSACGDCDWQGPTPDEDKCPGCGHENCMAVACPICGGRYRFLADRRFYLHAERARVPVGIEAAIAHIQQKAEAYAEEHCGVEWDTGATTYHHGQAGEEYHHGLLELVGELQAIAAAPSPPTGQESGEVE